MIDRYSVNKAIINHGSVVTALAVRQKLAYDPKRQSWQGRISFITVIKCIWENQYNEFRNIEINVYENFSSCNINYRIAKFL